MKPFLYLSLSQFLNCFCFGLQLKLCILLSHIHLQNGCYSKIRKRNTKTQTKKKKNSTASIYYKNNFHYHQTSLNVAVAYTHKQTHTHIQHPIYYYIYSCARQIKLICSSFGLIGREIHSNNATIHSLFNETSRLCINIH